jgi:hypothetical protein
MASRFPRSSGRHFPTEVTVRSSILKFVRSKSVVSFTNSRLLIAVFQYLNDRALQFRIINDGGTEYIGDSTQFG